MRMKFALVVLMAVSLMAAQGVSAAATKVILALSPSSVPVGATYNASITGLNPSAFTLVTWPDNTPNDGYGLSDAPLGSVNVVLTLTAPLAAGSDYVRVYQHTGSSRWHLVAERLLTVVLP